MHLPKVVTRCHPLVAVYRLLLQLRDAKSHVVAAIRFVVSLAPHAGFTCNIWWSVLHWLSTWMTHPGISYAVTVSLLHNQCSATSLTHDAAKWPCRLLSSGTRCCILLPHLWKGKIAVPFPLYSVLHVAPVQYCIGHFHHCQHSLLHHQCGISHMRWNLLR